MRHLHLPRLHHGKHHLVSPNMPKPINLLQIECFMLQPFAFYSQIFEMSKNYPSPTVFFKGDMLTWCVFNPHAYVYLLTFIELNIPGRVTKLVFDADKDKWSRFVGPAGPVDFESVDVCNVWLLAVRRSCSCVDGRRLRVTNFVPALQTQRFCSRDIFTAAKLRSLW